MNMIKDNWNIVSQIKSTTHAEGVELTDHVDETVLGGYILRIDDLQIDASIRKSFDTLRREMISTDYKLKYGCG